MAVLVDTCVLVAALHPGAAEHLQVRQALRQVRNAGESLFITPQNCAELWNVSTRPLTLNVRDFKRYAPEGITIATPHASPSENG